MPCPVNMVSRKVHELRHWIKWTVYSLLLINFGYYFWEEWVIASHTLPAGAALLQWTAAFAASIDEAAWFLLLGLFELETSAIPEKAFTPALERTLHIARIACYVFLPVYSVLVIVPLYSRLLDPSLASSNPESTVMIARLSRRQLFRTIVAAAAFVGALLSWGGA